MNIEINDYPKKQNWIIEKNEKYPYVIFDNWFQKSELTKIWKQLNYFTDKDILPRASFINNLLAFDGNGDFLSAVASPSFAFSTGDFTVEAWVYPTAYPNTYHTISATRGIIGTANGWSWNVQNNGTMIVYSNGFTYQGTVTGAVPLNAWTHVAFVRSSGNIQIYAGGSANKTGSIANLANFTIESLWVGTTGGIATGSGSGGDPFTGYINDLRITKGVARYTANFTPPTAPFPNF